MAVIFKTSFVGISDVDKRYQKREINLSLLSLMLEHVEDVLKFSHFCGDCA